MVGLKTKFLSWLGKRVFLKAARFCLYHAHGTKWCWICGVAPSMGPVWAGGHMTCNTCYDTWRWCHNDELIVDWRGIGRLRNKEQ